MRAIAGFIIWNCLLLFIPLQIFAQEVKFYAEAEANEVPSDGYFELYFKIENGNGVDLSPPNFANFRVLGPPSFSSQTSIINGEASRSSTYTFLLEPTATGRFSIGQATVKVNGKNYSSKPITIEVVKGKVSADLNDEVRAGGDIFARMELSSSVAYPGQQITLDYKVYSKMDVSSSSFQSESKYTGIYVKAFKNYDAGVKFKTINGQKYMVRILRKLALFPQQTGQVVIDPAVLTVGIPMDNEDPFGSLFSSTKPKQLRTNSVTLDVRTLPVPIPEGFLGAVGDFQYSVTTDKNELTTDDAAMLNFTISGNGDMKKIQTPALKADSIIDYYPAEVLEDVEQEVSGEWKGTKSYVIDLTPKKEGQFNIELPSFVYFDPKAKEYKTITPEPLPLAVSKGLNKPEGDSEEGELVREVSYFQKYKFLILGSAGGLIALAFVSFLFWPSNRKKSETRPEMDSESIKSIPLEEPIQLQKKLDVDALFKEAEILMNSQQWKEFFQNLNGIFGTFLSEKLDIPFSKFSIRTVTEYLKDNQTNSDLIDETRQLMLKLEGAVYARIIDQHVASEMLESVKDTIRKLS